MQCICTPYPCAIYSTQYMSSITCNMGNSQWDGESLAYVKSLEPMPPLAINSPNYLYYCCHLLAFSSHIYIYGRKKVCIYIYIHTISAMLQPPAGVLMNWTRPHLAAVISSSNLPLRCGQFEITQSSEIDPRWTHIYMEIWQIGSDHENITKTPWKHQTIHEGIISHHTNSSCVSTASGSTLGKFGKSLACQKISNGAAEGTYSCVHW